MRACLALCLGGVACTTTLADPTSLVTDPRVLAVSVEPPEAEPGAEVTFTSLYADQSGALAEAPIDWSFCLAGHPLAELGPVADACLDPKSEDLEPIASGIAAAGILPDDGCSRFGPNPPPADEGATGGRPADPDVTGGYYQPTLAFIDGVPTTLVTERIRCGLANVTQDTYVAWNTAYVNNTNPIIAEFTVEGAAGDSATVSAGSSVELAVSWPECSEEDGAAGCGGAETYTVWKPAEKVLDTRREAISATWFATAGTFGLARNGREGTDQTNSVTNSWAAPNESGEVWIAVVLRDERGGVTFEGFRVNVR